MTDRLAPVQLTREQAVAFSDGNAWRDMTPAERGLFQLRQDLLCLPFDIFHEGITALLDRPVWTHEFARPDDLWAEYEGQTPRASIADVMAKIPQHVETIVVLANGDD